MHACVGDSTTSVEIFKDNMNKYPSARKSCSVVLFGIEHHRRGLSSEVIAVEKTNFCYETYIAF